ncbi:2285_t:CDS:1, partial [Cetraspora pellucida]
MNESLYYQYLPNNVVPNSYHDFKPTFPPTIKNIDDLFSKKKEPSKSSNAFIIYHINFINELHSRETHLRMTDISPLVSKAWKTEPEN